MPTFANDCPEGAYEIRFTVTGDMADKQGRMRIGDLARQMQIAIEKHFDIVSGLTGEELHAQGKTLVIAWTYIEIFRLPKVGEKIILHTWPGKDKMMMLSGKFAMFTETGEPLMRTTSLFLLMDLVTRTMAERPVGMNHLDPVFMEEELKYPKISMPFPREFRNQMKRVVAPSEIDGNGHLNNTHYLDWAEALVDEDYIAAHEPKRVWVQYLKEMKEDDEVWLKYDWMNNTLMLRGIANGDDAFRFMMDL